MEDKIESERMGRDISTITELNLDNCKISSVVGLSENWTALEKLSLINVGLATLKGFPKLQNLKKLKLCDNRLSDGFEVLSVLTNLIHLNLSGNKITDFKSLEPLSKIKSLRSLNLVSCDISSQENYKDKIFALLPNLVYLDGFDKEENPEVEACSDSDIADGEEEEEEEDLEEEEELDDEEDIENEEEEDIPLEALYNKSYTNDTADDDDFEVIEDEDEGDEDIEEEDEEEEDVNLSSTSLPEGAGKTRGTKRKHEDEEEVKQNGKEA